MVDTPGRNKSHFYFNGHGQSEDFTSPSTGGGSGKLPTRDRALHAAKLKTAIHDALALGDQLIQARDPEIEGGTSGYYLEIDVDASNPAVVEKLEARQGKEQIELVSVRQHPEDEARLSATVFVPESKSGHYVQRIDAYETEDNVTYEKDDEGNRVLRDGQPVEKSRRPKNQALVAAMEDARLGQVKSLFTGRPASYPAPDRDIWWEVWLRSNRRHVFFRAAAAVGMESRQHILDFAERDVLLARGTAEQLGQIVSNTDAIAELRLATDTPSQFMLMDGGEQYDWAQELADRIVPPSDDAPAVCLLDSGSTRRHPLIGPGLAAADQQAWDQGLPVEDVSQEPWGGHGTEMSGVSLYGDLTELIAGQGAVALSHKLESVKILPDVGANPPELYGHITASAISLPEIEAPFRERAFCLAVTSADTYITGRPSSWSARLDELAYGEGEAQRFITVSAGNIASPYPANEYLNQNDVSGIENPAQAWNVLTVGATTEKLNVTDQTYDGWEVVDAGGDLSPASRTSLPWSQVWPLKPDVVFEGGNYAVNPTDGHIQKIDDLGLLTTFRAPEERAFTTTFDTSAATANAARMAAQIMSAKPGLWPETVRALIVQSAEWTPKMLSHVPAKPNKTQMRQIVRRYGFGLPNLGRAIAGTDNDVSIVIERDITPFLKNQGGIKTNEMILHDLPWPTTTLEALENMPVELRVTLSYFVEPNPGERGWTKRHSYPGHGLRFALKRPDESLQRFRRRINAAAREPESSQGGGGGDGWTLGPNLRDLGSLHSDIWRGVASDLADLNGMAVFPVGGWWREKAALGRYDRTVRYALVLSLRAEAEVDLRTEIENQIAVPVDIPAGA